QVREPEDGLTLPVGIGVHRIRPDVGRVLRDKIEDMMPLPGPTGNKAREEGNVGIRNEIVTNSPIPTVADVILGHEISGIDLPLSPVCRSRGPQAPQFW